MDISKKYLFEYYLSLQNDCIKELWKIKKNFKRRDIHNFRVCVKKINAFKSLLNFFKYGEKFDNELLRKLYNSAGKLRTNTLLKTELRALKISDKHLNEYFKTQSKKLAEKLEYQISSYSVGLKTIFKEEKTKLEFLLNESGNIENLSFKYLNNLFKKISEFEITNEKKKSPLHDLRKLMKEAGYNYDLICDAFYFLKDEVIMRQIDNLNKILGAWHDLTIFNKFIHKNNFKNSDRILQQLNNDVTKSENLIYSALQNFIKNLQELNF
ncbi:MAG: CHAD domain-containing protein [Bacteroidetes bacterium]|nr:CHAD domain-containing protein [Bacteroidota bacterium]